MTPQRVFQNLKYPLKSGHQNLKYPLKCVFYNLKYPLKVGFINLNTPHNSLKTTLSPGDYDFFATTILSQNHMEIDITELISVSAKL